MVLYVPALCRIFFNHTWRRSVQTTDLLRVLAIVNKFYTPIGREFGDGREFGCLAIRGPLTKKRPLELRVPFGVIPESSRCYSIALEKVVRLAEFPDHWSSHESRDPERSKYGGAIRLPETSLDIGYMSWSGYPEKTDEAFMLASAVRSGIMLMKRAEQIAEKNGNDLFRAVVTRMGVP